MTQLSKVSQNITRVDAFEKVTGKARFLSDLRLPSMLHGKVLRSPHASARIIRIDVSKAKEIAGVKSVVSGNDAPDVISGELIQDKYMFALDKVRYIGEPVAAVAATSPEIAEAALNLIDVEYEELPAVFGIKEAFSKKPDAVLHSDISEYERPMLPHVGLDMENRPNVHSHYKLKTGSMDKGFKEADLIVENEFYMARKIHCQLEPNNCIAQVEGDGSLTVWTTANSISRLKEHLCYVFQLSPSKVRVKSLYIGGAFGGMPILEAFAALLTLKTGKPVKIGMSRKEVFTSSYCGSPFIIKLKDGVKQDGTLIARELKIIGDGGAYAERTPMIVSRGVAAAVPIYKVPNSKIDSYAVYTNTLPAAPFRGFGIPEPTFALEQHMDIIAEKLGIDAVEFRKSNLLKEGDKNIQGEVTPATMTKECLEAAADWIGWDKQPANTDYPWKRGKGITLASKGTTGGTASTAYVKVHQDGSVELRHNADEVGQGANTVLAQIVAEEFDISPHDIKITRGDTTLAPFDVGSVSSRTSYLTGKAVQLACLDAKQQIFETAAGKLGVTPEQLEMKGGEVTISGQSDQTISIPDVFGFPFATKGLLLDKIELIGKGVWFDFPTDVDPETGQVPANPFTGEPGKLYPYYAEGAQAAEVEVNMETGQIKVLRFCSAFNMGRPLNPKMCEGQMEGGMAFCIGSALYEEAILDKGKMLNPNFKDYRLPFATQIPCGKNTKSMIIATPFEDGPYGVKGLGEGTVAPGPAAIANAVYNAIGVRIKELPITPNKVLNALKSMNLDESSP